jgi:hypothetical protein
MKGKKFGIKRKPLRKEMQKHQKRRENMGSIEKVLRNEIVKKPPKKKEKNGIKRKPLRNEIAKTPKRKGKK